MFGPTKNIWVAVQRKEDRIFQNKRAAGKGPHRWGPFAWIQLIRGVFRRQSMVKNGHRTPCSWSIQQVMRWVMRQGWDLDGDHIVGVWVMVEAKLLTFVWDLIWVVKETVTCRYEADPSPSNCPEVLKETHTPARQLTHFPYSVIAYNFCQERGTLLVVSSQCPHQQVLLSALLPRWGDRCYKIWKSWLWPYPGWIPTQST